MKDMFLMDRWNKDRKTVVAMSVAGAVLAAGCGGVLADNTSSGTMPETSRPGNIAGKSLCWNLLLLKITPLPARSP